MKLLPIDLYAATTVALLASAKAVDATAVYAGSTGVLDDPVLRIFLLLGALTGGLGAALTVAPGEDTKDAILKWVVSFAVSLSVTPGAFIFFDLNPKVDTVFSIAAITSLCAWVFVKFMRSLSVADIRNLIFRLLNVEASAKKTKKTKDDDTDA